MRHFLIVCVFLLAGCGTPADVRQFIERRDLCEHFGSEEPYDAARRAFLYAKVIETCTGTDAQLAELRAKHARNKHIMAQLSMYEDHVGEPVIRAVGEPIE